MRKELFLQIRSQPEWYAWVLFEEFGEGSFAAGWTEAMDHLTNIIKKERE